MPFICLPSVSTIGRSRAARGRRGAVLSLLVLTLASCGALTSSPAEEAVAACETFVKNVVVYDTQSTTYEADKVPPPLRLDELEEAAEDLMEAASEEERFRSAAESLKAWVDAASAYRDRYSNTDDRSGSEEARRQLNDLRLPAARECDAVFDGRV